MTTFNTMTFSIMALSVMALSIMALSVMTLSIITFRIIIRTTFNIAMKLSITQARMTALVRTK